MTIYSHPNQSWWKHTIDMQKIHDQNDAYIVFFHDIAKTGVYFQEYITSDEKQKLSIRNSGDVKYRHTATSALLYLYNMYTSNPLNRKQDDLIRQCLVGFSAIASHHSNKGIRLFVQTFGTKDYEDEYEEVVQGLNDKSINAAFDRYCTKFNIPYFNIKIPPTIDELYRHCDILLEQETWNKFLTQEWLDFKKTYSALVFSDVYQAINRTSENFLPPLPTDSFTKYLEEKQLNTNQSDLNKKRKQISDQAFNNYLKLSQSHDILQLIVPMGYGKTLTSLKIAFDIAEKENKKIIYTAPLVNILNQVYKEFTDIDKKWTKEKINSLILNHHNTKLEHTKDLDKKEFTDNEKSFDFMYDNLNARVNITSIHNLIESLVRADKKSCMKTASFMNSVVIIDEPQIIDSIHYKLIKKILICATKHLNMKFLIVTGTDPQIFTKEEAPFLTDTITPNPRTLVKSHINCPMHIRDFAKEIDIKYKTCVVLNTIDMVNELARKFKNRKDINLIVLTTNIPYVKRVEKIKEIKNYSDTKPLLVIATQMIEAGVDVSFDIGYRDMAPLDSIFQLAGRINRNGEQGNHAELHIYDLYMHKSMKDGSEQKYIGYSYVYHKKSIEETRKLLLENPIIHEKDYATFVRTYRNNMDQRNLRNEFVSILENWKECDTPDGHMLNSFSIIKEDHKYKVSIFIPLDDYAHQLWKQWKNARFPYPDEKQYEWINRIKKVRNEMNKYTVDVYLGDHPKKVDNQLKYLINANLNDIECMKVYKLDPSNKYYDETLGLLSRSMREDIESEPRIV